MKFLPKSASVIEDEEVSTPFPKAALTGYYQLDVSRSKRPAHCSQFADCDFVARGIRCCLRWDLFCARQLLRVLRRALLHRRDRQHTVHASQIDLIAGHYDQVRRQIE